jgi:hypothetical protein
MASTGTYLFYPELAELVDDAFEQAGLDPAQLDARHLKSAARSAELMMGSWFNRGWKQWQIKYGTQALLAGETEFTLPAGGWDIFHAMVVPTGEDAATPMMAISREDYSSLNDKTLTGRPDRYFTNRGTFMGADPASTVTVYLVPDKAYTVQYWYISRTEDVGRRAGNLDLPWHWNEAFTVGLAARLAKKFNPPRFNDLKVEEEMLIKDAMSSERELADTRIRISAAGSRRW